MLQKYFKCITNKKHDEKILIIIMGCGILKIQDVVQEMSKSNQ